MLAERAALRAHPTFVVGVVAFTKILLLDRIGHVEREALAQLAGLFRVPANFGLTLRATLAVLPRQTGSTLAAADSPLDLSLCDLSRGSACPQDSTLRLGVGQGRRRMSLDGRRRVPSLLQLPCVPPPVWLPV